MRNTWTAVGLALAIALLAAPVTSTPSFAICNEICQAKCKLQWQSYFKSREECVRVWSRRNGPTGFGCGPRGAPFVSCGD